MSELAEVRNFELLHQRSEFAGLCFNKNMYPTDIDAFMEFHDKVFIIIEAKWRSAKPPRGQLLALERLTDALGLAGKEAILILGSHNTAKGKEIDFGAMTVTRYRYRGLWRYVKDMNCRTIVDRFLKKNGLNYE